MKNERTKVGNRKEEEKMSEGETKGGWKTEERRGKKRKISEDSSKKGKVE